MTITHGPVRREGRRSCTKDPSLYPVSSIKDNSALNYLCQSSFTNIHKGSSDNGLVMLNERRIIWALVCLRLFVSLSLTRGLYTGFIVREKNDCNVLKNTAYPSPYTLLISHLYMMHYITLYNRVHNWLYISYGTVSYLWRYLRHCCLNWKMFPRSFFCFFFFLVLSRIFWGSSYEGPEKGFLWIKII